LQLVCRKNAMCFPCDLCVIPCDWRVVLMCFFRTRQRSSFANVGLDSALSAAQGPFQETLRRRENFNFLRQEYIFNIPDSYIPGIYLKNSDLFVIFLLVI